jgi:hypothetical protein
MSDLIADADELRHLAHELRRTRGDLEDAQRQADRILHGLNRTGWSASEADNRWHDAHSRVGEVLGYLDTSPTRLEQKALLIDELSGRPWPGVFAVAGLLCGGLSIASAAKLEKVVSFSQTTSDWLQLAAKWSAFVPRVKLGPIQRFVNTTAGVVVDLGHSRNKGALEHVLMEGPRFLAANSRWVRSAGVHGS